MRLSRKRLIQLKKHKHQSRKKIREALRKKRRTKTFRKGKKLLLNKKTLKKYQKGGVVARMIDTPFAFVQEGNKIIKQLQQFKDGTAPSRTRSTIGHPEGRRVYNADLYKDAARFLSRVALASMENPQMDINTLAENTNTVFVGGVQDRQVSSPKKIVEKLTELLSDKKIVKRRDGTFEEATTAERMAEYINENLGSIGKFRKLMGRTPRNITANDYNNFKIKFMRQGDKLTPDGEKEIFGSDVEEKQILQELPAGAEVSVIENMSDPEPSMSSASSVVTEDQEDDRVEDAEERSKEGQSIVEKALAEAAKRAKESGAAASGSDDVIAKMAAPQGEGVPGASPLQISPSSTERGSSVGESSPIASPIPTANGGVEESKDGEERKEEEDYEQYPSSTRGLTRRRLATRSTVSPGRSRASSIGSVAPVEEDSPLPSPVAPASPVVAPASTPAPPPPPASDPQTSLTASVTSATELLKQPAQMTDVDALISELKSVAEEYRNSQSARRERDATLAPLINAIKSQQTASSGTNNLVRVEQKDSTIIPTILGLSQEVVQAKKASDDLTQQVKELQSENSKLKRENAVFKKKASLQARDLIVRITMPETAGAETEEQTGDQGTLNQAVARIEAQSVSADS
mgnify:CR=1 FL=1